MVSCYYGYLVSCMTSCNYGYHMSMGVRRGRARVGTRSPPLENSSNFFLPVGGLFLLMKRFSPCEGPLSPNEVFFPCAGPFPPYEGLFPCGGPFSPCGVLFLLMRGFSLCRGGGDFSPCI